MVKPVLGIFFSFLLSLLMAPLALAQSGPSAATKPASNKKTVIKKSDARVVSEKKTVTGRRTIVAAAKSDRRKPTAVPAASRANSKVVKQEAASKGKNKTSFQRVAVRRVAPAMAAVLTAGDVAGLQRTQDPLDLKSSVALVMDQSSSEVLFEKNSNIALPIASITKLMTGLIVVEARQNMDEMLEITADDIDREKNSGSRLAVGTRLSRASLLHLALMSSENRAASALARHYPGGAAAFVRAMNVKAKELGMQDTYYVDSTGLSSRNVATARDLVKLVTAAQQHPILGYYSTAPESVVETNGRALQYRNTNHLIYNPDWEIGLQKTGYISEAGRCLVMQTVIEGRPIIMVFLDSKGKLSRLADAGRIRRWIETIKPPTISDTRIIKVSG